MWTGAEGRVQEMQEKRISAIATIELEWGREQRWSVSKHACNNYYIFLSHLVAAALKNGDWMVNFSHKGIIIIILICRVFKEEGKNVL